MRTFGWIQSRYATIIILTALFLVFDIGAFVLDFFITDEIKHDAGAVNMAGRQRMLSQRTAKIIFQLQNKDTSAEERENAVKELRLTVSLFDSTLKAFTQGGTITGGKGEAVYLKRVDSIQGMELLGSALNVWTPLFEMIAPLLESNVNLNRINFNEINSYVTDNNLVILGLMNQLTSERELHAASKAEQLRLIQLIIMFLSIVNFILILYHIVGRLRESDAQMKSFADNLLASNSDLEVLQEQLIETKNQTDEILETVGEGLFLIDRNGLIGEQYSNEMNHIFRDQQFSNRSFLDLMEPLLSEKDWKLTKDFLKLLFQQRLKEKMLLNVNPLDEVDVELIVEDGRKVQKILSFRFNRVLSNDKTIRHALVTVQDVTEHVMLARQLDQQKEEAKQQIELLHSAIQCEPAVLSSFISETVSRLDTINKLLKSTQDGTSKLYSIVKRIYREIHSLKGDASILGLGLFEKMSHQIEDELTRLQGLPQLSGEHFVKLALNLDELRGYLDDMINLIDGVSELNKNVQYAANPKHDAQFGHGLVASFVNDITALANTIAKEKGRCIAIDTTHFDPKLIPSEYFTEFKDLIIQLVRNAIVHGIETPLERQRKSKLDTGIVRLATEKGRNNMIDLVIRDDGRGIDIESIRQQASDKGLWSQQELEQMDNQNIAALIFEPGFSTASEIDSRAGRGIGMDVVKTKVRQMGGQLRLAYSPNRFAEFRISIPAKAA